MEGWIKWLGEFVWRISKVPGGIRENERDENFWFRMYGLLTLLLSLGVGMLTLRFWIVPLSEILLMLSQYTKGDRVIAQSYFVAGLVVIMAVPVIFAAITLLAVSVAIIPGLVLRWTKFATWASVKWATRFQAKQQAKELTPSQKEAVFIAMMLSFLAIIILWAALKTGALPAPPLPTPEQPLEPPDDKKDDAQPAA